MKTKLFILLLSCLLLPYFSHAQQDDKSIAKAEALKLVKSLKYKQGDITIQGGLAKLTVPKEFNYLDPDDAEKVLVKLWGNPPGHKTLGLLIPADVTPLDKNCWVVTIHYVEEGYIKDDDAGKINYDDELKKMKEAVREASAEREKKGYDSIELIGWAAPPHYDADSHKLYWAKEINFGHQPENTLNYNIRMLGRRGYLMLNGVSSMSQLPEIEKQTPQILSMVNFNDGNKYADFDPKVDKVATYGLAALVAGGIAAKAGLFKVILVGLLAAKKFVIIAFVAVVGFFKKLFGRSKNNSPS